MGSFVIVNHTTRDRRIGIEPWAEEETLQPDDRMRFEYDEPADLSFAISEFDEVSLVVGVSSDMLTIETKHGKKTWK